MTQSLKATTLRNVGYNTLAKVISLGAMAVANIILTRTLLPSDYGIVGFAIIFVNFLNQFSDLGIGNAAVQKKDLVDRELYTAFTVKFLLGIAISTLAFLCAPLLLHFFENPAIVNVMRVLSLTFILSTFSCLPNILLTRELNYRRLSLTNQLPAILNSVVAVSLALLGFGYWSLVISCISMFIGTAVLTNLARPVRYRFAYDPDAARQFINFGKNIFMSGVIAFLIFNADNFIIGAVQGATTLGYYSLAFNWGTIACTTISAVILSVLFPTFTRMQDDRARLKFSYLRILEFLSFAGGLANMTLFVISRDFLIHVLGQGTGKWLPALTVLRLLCVYGIMRILLEPVTNVVMAIGRTDLLRKAALCVAIAELSFLYPALRYFGIVGVAVVVNITYLLQFFVYYSPMRQEIGLTLRDLRGVVAPALGAALTLVPLYLIFETKQGSSLTLMALKILACVAAYTLSYGLFSRGKLYREFSGILKGSKQG